MLNSKSSEEILQKRIQDISAQSMNDTIICMAILQSYSQYAGAEEFLAKVSEDKLKSLQGRLVSQGLLTWSPGNKACMLSTKGHQVLKMAIKQQEIQAQATRKAIQEQREMDGIVE